MRSVALDVRSDEFSPIDGVYIKSKNNFEIGLGIEENRGFNFVFIIRLGNRIEIAKRVVSNFGRRVDNTHTSDYHLLDLMKPRRSLFRVREVVCSSIYNANGQEIAVSAIP